MLVALGPVADTSGVLRQLRGRIASWTRQGRDPRRPPADDLGGIVGAEEWAIYGRYRSLLGRLKAEDEEGFAGRAARELADESPHPLHAKSRFFLVDPIDLGHLGWQAIEAIDAWADAIGITLPFDPDLADAYGPARDLRERLLEVGFEEVTHEIPADRPAGLIGVEVAAFRDDPGPPLDRTDGLFLLGAPRGEGEAAVIARRVRELLAGGARPDSILLLARSRGALADLAAETLRAWGIPAASTAPGHLAADPAVAALILAVRVPATGWESAGLIALLRHGEFRPDWPEARDPLALPTAAAAVRDARVFRDGDRLREAIRAAAAEDIREARDDLGLRRRRAARAQVAGPILQRLADAFAGLDRPAPWADRVDQLRELAARLGIGSDQTPSPRGEAGRRAGEGARVQASGRRSSSILRPPLADPPPGGGGTRRSLGSLFDALDDHGETLDALGHGAETWRWADFAAEVVAIVRDIEVPAPAAPPNAVRLMTAAEAEGARVDHVLLIDLAEGAFPDRRALEPGGADDPESGDAAYAREQLRFVRVVGSAVKTLTLVYPTTDEKGQALLAAGFLDDVRRPFAAEVRPPFAPPIARLDPALMPADLAGSAADARVRAVAWAAATGGTHDLRRLARSPGHREPLMAVAEALRVSRSRLRDADYGPFDGILLDGQAIRRVADDFAPERHVFSPSQLESLATCPFQFFQRYVLRLEPPDDRDELDDDHAARGSLIHHVLEQLHITLRDGSDEDGTPLADRVDATIDGVIERALDGERSDGSDVAVGLHAIQAGRLRKVGRRYRYQFKTYAAKLGEHARARHFEIQFGKPADVDGPPALRLGEGASAVRLRGMIDRIDVEAGPEGTTFRVIDYKSNQGPGKGDLERGLALQLPLYALAVERLKLAGEDATPADAGYWSLGKKGYSAVLKAHGKDPRAWEVDRGRFERYVIALVVQLRLGAFPVRPRVDDCTRLCDFHAACRIVQVRVARKGWADEPRLEGAPR